MHWGDDVLCPFVDYVLDFLGHGFPFDNDDVEVMVEVEAAEEEAAAAAVVDVVVVVGEEAVADVDVCGSLEDWYQHCLGCQVSVFCVVCIGSDAEGVLFLGV